MAVFHDVRTGSGWALLQLILFLGIVLFLIYGNALYQFTRLGYLGRLRHHAPPAMHDVLASFRNGAAPALTVLIPSYKEDAAVVRKTLLSAALQHYPNKRVVLLIDDPPAPSTSRDLHLLESSRALPGQIAEWMHLPSARVDAALIAFFERMLRDHITLSPRLLMNPETYRYVKEETK
jgi:cellulose synthase/poly-beta-1,6-N-acetylglucosamine synthase-like glycosyltransferase